MLNWRNLGERLMSNRTPADLLAAPSQLA
jgi:hypothetical protein